MSLVSAILLLAVTLAVIDLYRRSVPPTRAMMVCAVLAVLLALWLLLELLGIGGNVRL